MTGRPSTYTQEMGDLICDRLTEGMSLRKLCKSAEFPNASTVYVWLDRFPSFAEQYARAREAATEDMLEEILEIADDPKIDTQDKRVRIDARKWAMGKLKPKKYGEKQTHEIGNKDGETLKVDSNVDTIALTLQLAEALRMKSKDK
jgi:transposase